MLYNSNSNKDGEPEEEFEHSKWQLKYCFNGSIVCYKEANKQERAAAWEAELVATDAPVKAVSALARNQIKKPTHVTGLSALARRSSNTMPPALHARLSSALLLRQMQGQHVAQVQQTDETHAMQ